jgi:hypothetical protein
MRACGGDAGADGAIKLNRSIVRYSILLELEFLFASLFMVEAIKILVAYCTQVCSGAWGPGAID